MSTYVIGDVQGCYSPLMRLLDKINFNPNQDQLWFTGDLVNRGPESLNTLRFIYKTQPITVLGNHDIHLISTFDGLNKPHPKDSFQDILKAPDAEELIHYLRQQPLLFEHCHFGLVHAGIHPAWSWDQAKEYAVEAENFLKNKKLWLENLDNFYGNQPSHWENTLSGMERLRMIFNIFTRLRICKANGDGDFSFKGPLEQIPHDYFPWFAVPNRNRQIQNKIILFGHWSHLRGVTHQTNAIALDTGCVWGDVLTAYCLETQIRTSVPA